MPSFLQRFARSTKATFVPQRKSNVRVKCVNAFTYFGEPDDPKNENAREFVDALKREVHHHGNAYDSDDEASTRTGHKKDEHDLNVAERKLTRDSEEGERIADIGKLAANKKEEEHSMWYKITNYIPLVSFVRQEKKNMQQIQELEADENYIITPLDTFIGVCVDITGSIWAFIIAMSLLIAWVVWGACTGAPDTWQIVMQDGQSIQTYVWDTFLMRQQLDDNDKFLFFIGKLRSRTQTHKRLLEDITMTTDFKADDVFDEDDFDDKKFNWDDYVKYDKKTYFDKFCDVIAKLVGSLPMIIIYWLGIFAWVGCGALKLNQGTPEEPDYEMWSDTWQMYINTATAIELLFTSVFLENVRARTNGYIMKQIEVFNKFDGKLEYYERMLSNYHEDNDLVVVERVHRDKIQKCISWYATVIGNGLGLIISTCVFIAWACIGEAMKWSDNWWLIIGTYTGLVGFIDGFVLREVFFAITNDEMTKYEDLLRDSQQLLDIVGIETDISIPKRKKNLTVKVSLWVNKICSNEWSVLFSIAVVIGLVVMASALLWSETAQLVCNTPTMIIEGFFLLILIQAQHWASDDRIDILTQLTKNRVLLTKYIERLVKHSSSLDLTTGLRKEKYITNDSKQKVGNDEDSEIEEESVGTSQY